MGMDSVTAIHALKAIKGGILHDPSWIERTHKQIEELFDMAIQAIEERDGLNIVHCNECGYYDGEREVGGHGLCKFWSAGNVYWNWFCSQGDKDYANKEKRIVELVDILNRASAGDFAMTPDRYDELFDELVDLEAKTGYVLPDSPNNPALLYRKGVKNHD